MIKIMISVAALWLMSACSPGQIHANHNGGGYVYVGFSPFGDLEVGQKIYFKQVDAYGEVGMVMTARPCKEGE